MASHSQNYYNGLLSMWLPSKYKIEKYYPTTFIHKIIHIYNIYFFQITKILQLSNSTYKTNLYERMVPHWVMYTLFFLCNVTQNLLSLTLANPISINIGKACISALTINCNINIDAQIR